MMTQHRSRLVREFAVAAAAVLLTAAGAVHAQERAKDGDDVEPWRQTSHPTPAPHATSSLEATKATPKEQIQTRSLASAVFSRPGAAQRAADKAAAANAPAIPPADPKPEWLTEQGLRPGGQGLQLSTPF